MLTKNSAMYAATRRLTGVLLLAAASISLASCDLAENYLKTDRSGHMEMQDYRDGLAPRMPEGTDDVAAADDAASIPSLQSYVASPSENLRAMPLVSISVNQTIPLRDALYDLAAQANYDIELDPRIVGSIIFTARERPLDMVVQRISEIAGLRYKFEDDVVRVELDTPFQKTYKLDYLSSIRKSSSNINNSVSVVKGDGADAGSRFKSDSKTESNFWGELEVNLTQMLGSAPGQGMLRTTQDPELTAVEQNPAPVDPVVVPPPEGTAADGSAQPTVEVQPPQATLQVQPLPPVDGGRNNRNSNRNDEEGAQAGFSINKQAGVIAVFATERQHKMVAEYLDEVRRSSTAQVLIEAKVLEVNLSDEYAVGIDWTAVPGLSEGLLTFDGGVALARPSFSPDDTDADFQIGWLGDDFETVIDAISRFGTVKALASPRMTVLNNQSAVLNVARNQVYFELEVEVSTTTEGGVTQRDTSVDSDIRTVPEGVLINVMPSIDLDKRSISMAVRPTITKITEFVDDPSVTFAVSAGGLDENIVSSIPVVDVQEMDSMINISSGQTIVMGGLLQDSTTSTQQGVPVLGEMPLFGGLFRNQVDGVTKKELVVFLRATIIDGSNSTIHQTDKDLYKKFSGDRRPLDL